MPAFHKFWIKQCEAAREVKEQFGSRTALGYLVGEKLLNFVSASDTEPDFAAELPSFILEITDIFGPEELRDYLDTVSRVGVLGHIMDDEAFESAREAKMFEESVVQSAEDVIRMGRIREMLLGESP